MAQALLRARRRQGNICIGLRSRRGAELTTGHHLVFSCKPLARKLQTAACLASPLRASGLPPGAGVVSYQAAVGTIEWAGECFKIGNRHLIEHFPPLQANLQKFGTCTGIPSFQHEAPPSRSRFSSIRSVLVGVILRDDLPNINIKRENKPTAVGTFSANNVVLET